MFYYDGTIYTEISDIIEYLQDGYNDEYAEDPTEWLEENYSASDLAEAIIRDEADDLKDKAYEYTYSEYWNGVYDDISSSESYGENYEFDSGDVFTYFVGVTMNLDQKYWTNPTVCLGDEDCEEI